MLIPSLKSPYVSVSVLSASPPIIDVSFQLATEKETIAFGDGLTPALITSAVQPTLNAPIGVPVLGLIWKYTTLSVGSYG